MKQLVTCDFLGRLGNNMFQVAAVIGLAKKHGVAYGIPPHYRHRQIYQHFSSLPKFRGNSSWFHTHDEGQHTFRHHDIPFHRKGVKLRGFFQSEKYFEQAADEVRAAFPLRIYPTNRVSIHVRRGDYVKYVDNFLPTTAEDVQKAVEFFQVRGYDHFLICSDDIPWCKANLSRIDTKFDFNEGTNEYQDLSDMASCAHHVVSRSSFSWWAAWLGHSPYKIVVALTPWFGTKNGLYNQTQDIIPERWLKI
jgi:hypothetical protein